MNVVIIYDHLGLAVRANAMLARTAARAGALGEWSVKPWRLDFVSLPLTADTAVAEAAAADLVVLALRDPAVRPPWLDDWLESWAETRGVEGAALALFADAADDHGAVPGAVQDFSQFTVRHGLDFLVANVVVDDGVEDAEPASALGRA